MEDKEMYDIFQMVNNITLLMDVSETPENADLFEKIRWVLQEMEYKVVRMSNSLGIMEQSFTMFSEAYKLMQEEINYKYRKPTT